jgi:hypothetical protein
MNKGITYIILAIILLMGAYRSSHAAGMALTKKDTITDMPVASPVYSSLFARLVDRLVGIDIIFDTSVAKNRLFNYRLSIDCDTYTDRKDYLFLNYSYNVNRLVCANTFGFGFVRTQYMRIWAGPQLALSYEFKNRNNTIADSKIFQKIGPVVGFNFHVGDDMSISLETGFRMGFGFHVNKTSGSIFGMKAEPMMALKLIFRTWDTFVPSNM